MPLQKMRVFSVAIVMGLAALAAHANDRTNISSKANTPPKTAHAEAAPDSAAGNTAVHRFFNAWGNGMQSGAKAIGLDKDPLEGKLPQIQAKPLFSDSNETDKRKR